VPYCPKGTGWWFGFVFGGILLVVIGGLMSGASSVALILPAIFLAIGIGALTVAFDSGVSSATKTFALIFGGCFTAAGLFPAFFLLLGGAKKLGGAPSVRRSSGAGSAAPTRHAAVVVNPNAAAEAAFGSSPGSRPFGESKAEPDAIMGAYLASKPADGSAVRRAPSPQTQKRNDVMDKIARLADLHKSGALTDDEFDREKAKLLAEL
jgi:hypothetical protein